MKYSKITDKAPDVFFRITYFFVMLVVLGLTGGFLWCDLTLNISMLSLLWLIWLPTIVYAMNFFIAIIAGDKISVTDENLNVVKTPRYYSRSTIAWLIGCILFVPLIVRYIFLIPYDPAISIVGIVFSIAEMVMCFILRMSAYEKSGFIKIKLNNQEKEKQEKEEENK